MKTNALKQFFKEMCGDQSGEFVFGYWDFDKGFGLGECKIQNESLILPGQNYIQIKRF